MLAAIKSGSLNLNMIDYIRLQKIVDDNFERPYTDFGLHLKLSLCGDFTLPYSALLPIWTKALG